MGPLQFFEAGFSALTEHSPFHWQRELFLRCIRGDWPRHVDLPTGTGKTSVVYVWLLALAWSLSHPETPPIPRRLVWVVNRRVVVDQVTAELERLLAALRESQNPVVRDLAATLTDASATRTTPLAVSTLRGEHADNREWSLDPSRPAVIVGTVDMIGSRLLFAGYGDSRYRRPHHAGLLGQDSVIVHDEAQLTPAFADLIERVSEYQAALAFRPVQVLQLTATHRQPHTAPFPDSLDLDAQHPVFQQRLEGRKTLIIHQSAKDARKSITELALAGAKDPARVIVFVTSPADALDIQQRIENKHPGRTALLTGQLRGHERDQLALDPVFAGFKPAFKRPAPLETLWLIATSAAEVGADLDADRAVFDLSPADSLIQRLGRVNRFGNTEARIDLVLPSKLEGALEHTHNWLRELPRSGSGHNVSTRSLRERRPPAEALSPAPGTVHLPGWGIEALTLTSLTASECPVRANLHRWLHGLDEEGEPPITYLAWRQDVQLLADFPNSDVSELLDDYPVLPHERIQIHTSTAREALQRLGSTHVLVQQPDGPTELCRASDVGFLDYATVVLPPKAGGLTKEGAFALDRIQTPATDVADTRVDRRRWYLTLSEDGWQAARLTTEETRTTASDRWRDLFAGDTILREVELERESDASPADYLIYTGSATAADSSYTAQRDVLLKDHSEHVTRVICRMAECLRLPPDLTSALARAAELHDSGKEEPLWQRTITSEAGGEPLAKSRRLFRSLVTGYRHELGSVARHPAQDDLVLHLIASHHGWARPHFEPRAYLAAGSPATRETALEATQRFARVQRRYGPWSLAWLEAILRSADAHASQLADSKETTDVPAATHA